MSSSGFVFAGLPTRVISGRGTVAQVADEVPGLMADPRFSSIRPAREDIR
jgi:hypothetical protein